MTRVRSISASLASSLPLPPPPPPRPRLLRLLRLLTTSSLLLLPLLLPLLLLLLLPVDAKSPIAFRLDDIQCAWKDAEQAAIVDAFLRHGVPLTIGIITNADPTSTCFTDWLNSRVAATSDAQLEIASHSATHIDMTGMGVNYDTEIKGSRDKLVSLYPTRTISLFIPPFNAWNLSVAAAVAAAGYTVISPLCTYDMVKTYGSATTPDACTTNVYTDVQYPYFAPLDGLYHMPIGSATANFLTPDGIAVAATQVLSASSSVCATTGVCSCASQIEATTGRMVLGGNARPFAVVMMHPQDFGNMTTTAIGAYFDELLPLALASYEITTVSGLVSAALTTTTTTASSTADAAASSSASDISSSAGAASSSGVAAAVASNSNSSSSSSSGSSSSSSSGSHGSGGDAGIASNAAPARSSSSGAIATAALIVFVSLAIVIVPRL